MSAGRVETALVQTMDIFATCAEIGNGDASTGRDSVSLIPYLESAESSPRRKFVFAENRPDTFKPGDTWGCESCGWDVAIAANVGENGGVMKLIVSDYSQTTNDSLAACRRTGSGTASNGRELYDLTNDPWETVNRSGMTPADISSENRLREIVDSIFGGKRCA